MVEFLLARHGPTKMNKGSAESVDRERSWSDVPLTREGELVAQKTGLQLRGKGVEHMSSSNLHRSAETARIIGQHIGVKPHLEHDLRPWNVGDFAGKNMKDVNPQVRDYAENKPDEPVPGGESFHQFKSRALGAVAKHIIGARNRRSLLVSHHRVERLLSSLRPDGSTDFNEFFKDGERPGGVERFNLDPGKLRQYAKQPAGQGKPPPNADEPESQQVASPDVPAHTHNLALGGAHHLAKAGLITPEQHKQIKRRVRNAMLMRASLREA